ncbi:MAG: LysM peptidoglycan-binding domain-containing protein [Nitrospirae bacterium]|nr:LysM peptidoglycan-binding domain-containing protein [Nitrospirota bacterium]
MKKTLYCLLLFIAFFVTSLNAQNTKSEEYIVEKFDTLWGISSTKLEDAFLWPKLWNVNPHIENPDLIYPGTRIIIPSREELMRMPAIETKTIPIARKHRGHKIKESEPKNVWEYAPLMEKKYIIEKNLYIASGWIADKFPSVGKLTFSPMDRNITGMDDIVYIKYNGDIKSEKRFFAIRDIKVVKHPISEKKIGHQIRITGILEVIGMDQNMTKAKVINSFEDIQIGDGLLPYQEMEPPLIPETARTPDLHGYIIESHMNSYLLGEGAVVFLDKGEKDGLKIGDVFSVLSEPPSESPIGKIQIVSLQPSTSGAVLVDSTQEITIGTKWGQKK